MIKIKQATSKGYIELVEGGWLISVTLGARQDEEEYKEMDRFALR